MLSFGFYDAKLWIIWIKLSVIIVLRNKNHMSKSQGVFTEYITIFFSNGGKTESVPEFEFERF